MAKMKVETPRRKTNRLAFDIVIGESSMFVVSLVCCESGLLLGAAVLAYSLEELRFHFSVFLHGSYVV